MNSSPLAPHDNAVDSRLAAALLAMVACLYTAAALWSNMGLGYGGDSFSHYLIARYSWKHPHLLLHSWGKPFFTLVSSPFAQLGWGGMLAFNIACGTLTAYVVYRYCRGLRLPHSWVSIVLVALMPIYFRQVPSGLTEPLFALMVAASAYLFLIERFAASCLLVSFLPLVRTEGLVILPLFAVALLVKRQAAALPLLATGVLLYSVVGYFVKNDLFWMKTESYGYHNPVYARRSATLLHYFTATPYLFGVALPPLIVVGLGWMLATFARMRTAWTGDKSLLVTALIMTGSFGGLFSAYALLTALGVFGVIGDKRYIAVVAPGATVTAMLGLRWATARLGDRRPLRRALVAAVCLLAVFSAYRLIGRDVGRGPSRENVIVRDAARWLKGSGHAREKVYYFDPIVPFETDIDPFDNRRAAHLWALRRESPPRGAIIFWDAHYGPNHARLPLSALAGSRDLVLLKSFVPAPPFKTLGNAPFEVHIFQKTTDAEIALYTPE
jgi:hypothetical protein